MFCCLGAEILATSCLPFTAREMTVSQTSRVPLWYAILTGHPLKATAYSISPAAISSQPSWVCLLSILCMETSQEC